MIPELEQIERLLWEEWDPIGCDVPEDEYNSYAFKIFTSLHGGASEADVTRYLEWAERENMGLSHASGRAKGTAQKIMAIHAHAKASPSP